MSQEILTKIQQQMKEKLYLGASLALFESGSWKEFYLGESEEGLPTKPQLVYDLASVSKVVGVGTVLIFLIRSGKIKLDSPLKFYYPAFQNASVTIRQLATHTSGIDPYIPNRNNLDRQALKKAIDKISVTSDTTFLYTDINVILLGFLLEHLYQKELGVILQEEIFSPWGMLDTSFGPRTSAVRTVKGNVAGIVHDPKAQVLGPHCGSAGLFSTIRDLEIFLEHYLVDDFAQQLNENISPHHSRSIVWNIDGDWLDHTGYTGPFVMVNRRSQKAAIFLTNRTYYHDNRELWIQKRRELRDCIKETLK